MDKEKMQEQTEETVENTEVKEENTAEETVETVEENVIGEAMTIYHMPIYKKLKEILESGKFGKVNLITMNFGSFKEYDMNNRFFNKNLAVNCAKSRKTASLEKCVNRQYRQKIRRGRFRRRQQPCWSVISERNTRRLLTLIPSCRG